MKEEIKYLPRPENLLEEFGVNFKNLSEEERQIKKLLTEEYKKRRKSIIIELRKWREDHPDMTLADSIRALYKGVEEKE